MKIRHLLMASLLACSALPTGASASGDDLPLTDDVLARIRTVLVAQGYEVGKIKTEDGLYEAYVRKGEEKLEIFLDADMKIVRTETDD